MVQGFEERMARLETDIKDSQKRASELETKVGSAFEKEERYHFLVKRQAEIEGKLDLTKNQAPVQAEEISQETNDEADFTRSIRVSTKHRHTKKPVISI